MYDLIIIGGSSAATAAGVYAARRGLNFKLVTKDFGGELATSGEIGNWPGIPKTTGIDLSRQFRAHLDALKVQIDEGIEVEKIIKQKDNIFCITSKDNDENYLAKTVIVATGGHPRELKIPGEKEFRLKGVSYCTVCDGPIFAGKVTVTIGGGNSALESALMLADIASKTYIITINPELMGEQVLIENLKAKKNVDLIYNATTTKIIGPPAGEAGKNFASGLVYKDKEGMEHEIKTNGIFVHIGMVANSFMVPPQTERDQFGYIKINALGETNVPGLFAAGDVTDVPYKQNPIAAGQGTIALLSAVGYLNRL